MRYNQPQSGPLTIDRNNPLGLKVIECISLSGTRYSVVGNRPVAYGNGGNTIATTRGKGLRGAGAGARASIALDLSKYSVITLAFWLYWDAYANDDAFAMEFTANANSNAGAFYVDPNSGAGGGKLAIVPNGSGANGNGMLYDRPSAATWHRYCISIDIRTQLTTLAIDGAAVSGITAGATATTGSTFANSTLNLFSRAGTGLLGTGTMQDLTIYAGSLSANEIAQDFTNPWQIYATPQRRLFASAVAATPVTASLSWAEADEAMSIASLLTNRASAAWAEAGDAMTVTSVVTDRGAISWTEQGDAVALTGTAQMPAAPSITAAMAWAEAGDTASIVTRLLNRASITATEQGDTWSLTAYAEPQPVRPTISLTVRFNVLPHDFNPDVLHLKN